MLGKYVLSDCFLSTKLDATGVKVLMVGILSWNEEKSVSLHKTQHIHYMIYNISKKKERLVLTLKSIFVYLDAICVKSSFYHEPY